MRRNLMIALVSALTLVLASCAITPALPTASEALGDEADLSSLVDALELNNLVDTVEAQDAITILAPTNAAFAALAAQQDQETIDLLTYHVLVGSYSAADLADGQVLSTLFANSGIGVSIDGQDVSFVDGSDSPVATAGIQVAATVSEADIEIANGFVHKIDMVLTPPADIATIATNAGLDSLVAALSAAGLAGTFADSANGPFTVFAPTEAAFANLLAGRTLQELIDDLGGTQALADVLSFHVVPALVGEAAAIAAVDTPVDTLLANKPITPVPAIATAQLDNGLALDTDGDGFGDANIIATNIVASNGVIHLIDAVMVPPADEPVDQ